MDQADPSYEKMTSLTGSHFARDLEKYQNITFQSLVKFQVKYMEVPRNVGGRIMWHASTRPVL